MRTPYDVVDRWAGQAAGQTQFVAHSNAGFLAPSTREACGSSGRIVFIDAALPPESEETPLAPPAMREHVVTLADPATGILPPWTRWWSREDLQQVIPADWFDVIDAACPAASMQWFDSRVRPPAGWTRGPHAYLAFGDTYAHELALAEALTWPTRVLDGGHLHFLWRADEVVKTVLTLLEH